MKCLCGCDETPKLPTSNYCVGHHFRIPKNERIPTKNNKMCLCGCGEIPKSEEGAKYCKGHYSRSKKFKDKMKIKLEGATYMNDPEVKARHIASLNTKEIKDKLSKNGKQRWKNPLYRKRMMKSLNSEEIIKNAKNRAKEWWKDKEFQEKMQESRHTFPNQPETQLFNILQVLFPNEYQYTGNFSNWINGKNPDFTHIEEKKVIELFGDYWHQGEDPNIRINHFNESGYECLIIWEHELKDVDNLEKKILNFNAPMV